MKGYDEMFRDVLVRRDEEVIKIRKRCKVLIGAACGVVACALAVFAIPKLSAKKISPKASLNPSIIIVWSSPSYSDLSNVESEPLMGKIGMDSRLKEALEAASPDDYLAFVYSPKVEYKVDQHLQELYEKCHSAEISLGELQRSLAEKLIKENGISDTEANARVSSYPEVLEAKKELNENRKAYAAYSNRITYSGHEDKLDLLKEKGFVILCTYEDERYKEYLRWGSGIAVCAGTPDMIRDLVDKSLEENNISAFLLGTSIIRHAPEEYDQSIVHLQEDTKLTDELRAEYAENGGAPVKVVVKMGWVGEWTDPHVYAYASVGMTEKQFTESNDLTDAQVEKYLETLRYYTYWVRPDTVEPLLEDGELVEIRSHMWDFVAELSYERAMELCENKKVAYITSFSYLEKCREWEGAIYSVIATDESAGS